MHAGNGRRRPTTVGPTGPRDGWRGHRKHQRFRHRPPAMAHRGHPLVAGADGRARSQTTQPPRDPEVHTQSARLSFLLVHLLPPPHMLPLGCLSLRQHQLTTAHSRSPSWPPNGGDSTTIPSLYAPATAINAYARQSRSLTLPALLPAPPVVYFPTPPYQRPPPTHSAVAAAGNVLAIARFGACDPCLSSHRRGALSRCRPCALRFTLFATATPRARSRLAGAAEVRGVGRGLTVSAPAYRGVAPPVSLPYPHVLQPLAPLGDPGWHCRPP